MDFEERKEIFKHFYHTIPCTYSLTCEIDITPIYKSNKGINVCLLYVIARVLNRIDNFRMFYHDGELGCYDMLHPSFTLLNHKKSGFLNLYFEYSEDFEIFKSRYLQTIEKYKNSCSLLPQGEFPKNVFMFSSIPWIKFSSFNLNLDQGSKYLLPILTVGKFQCDKERVMIPISVQVHHSACDGYHLALFFKGLEEEILHFV